MPNLIGFFLICEVQGTDDPNNFQLKGIETALQQRLEDLAIQQGAVSVDCIEVFLEPLGYLG